MIETNDRHTLTPDILRMVESGIIGRTLCPSCGGGSTSERSLSVRPTDVPGQWKASCWRSTCGFWQIVGGSTEPQAAQQPEAVYFDDSVRSLVGTTIEEDLADYCIDPHTADRRGWRVASGGRLVMPVLDRHGSQIGTTTRTFTKPKQVRTYKSDHSCAYLDWHCDPSLAGGPVLIVEDQISALRASEAGVNAIALMGTNLTPEAMTEISDAGYALIYIALDNDVFQKSLDYASKYSHYGTVVPLYLPCDIKSFVLDSAIRALVHEIPPGFPNE